MVAEAGARGIADTLGRQAIKGREEFLVEIPAGVRAGIFLRRTAPLSYREHEARRQAASSGMAEPLALPDMAGFAEMMGGALPAAAGQ